MAMEMLVPLGLMILFLILSIILLQGKGAFLIAGYNTMPAEEKAKYDEMALCKATGKVLLSIAFSMAIIFVGEYLQLSWLLIIGNSLMVATIVVALVYMNTGDCYKLNDGS
ncbi:hypothetical protein QOZ98_000080 [Planomicrobium stackebrandtii]|uniref:DUF3784 domain-containing protein n=1 Tax=Planomicrobium stackebrandtii TaxID=253160 RepID=A0ABU0GRL1_9BACL|nr:DUF3784 domain-containing protein [Planomicrobium stackebrandtii]MDQ0427255.1 hypothetical protein [Planomicrobium stackebrandtii]